VDAARQPARHRCIRLALDAAGSLLVARRYSRKAQKNVERALHEQKRGRLQSGRSGSKVKSRKQAIAIGLAEARRAGARVPKKPKRR